MYSWLFNGVGSYLRAYRKSERETVSGPVKPISPVSDKTLIVCQVIRHW